MSTNTGKLSGKIALITGGSSGLGLATAKRFVGEGAHVFITGRRQPELDAAVKEIGGSVTAVRGDVSNLADLDRLFATMRSRKAGWIFCLPMPAAERLRLSDRSPRSSSKIFRHQCEGHALHRAEGAAADPSGGAIVINGSMVSH